MQTWQTMNDGDVAGTRVGSYRIVRRIASGGMGVVFLAQRETWTRDFSKPFALKVMHPHLAREKSFVRMFLDEARVAIQISHPHVCNVIEVGVADGAQFLVMEYLNGKTLGNLIKETAQSGPPPATSHYFYETYQHYIARIIADAAEGLHGAHETKSADGVPLEIVHRDVSPHNIMVTYDGAVKVVDFGIARARERLEETSSGLVKGKLKYCSPEQLSGKDVDRRTDIWSLGVCLWEAVTLRHPFHQTDQGELIAAISQARIGDPRAIAPWLHPELERILLRCLAKDPAARFSNARDLSVALRAFLFSAGTMVEANEVADWLTAREPASAAGAPILAPDEDVKNMSDLSVLSAGELENDPSVTHNERTGQLSAAAANDDAPVQHTPTHAAKPWKWLAASVAAVLMLTGVTLSIQNTHLPATVERGARDAPKEAAAIVPVPPPEPVVAANPRVAAVQPPHQELKRPMTPRAAPAEAQPQRAPKPLVAESASLNVLATGGTVQVWVDGQLRGHSPIRVDVASGPHQVKLVDLSSGEASESNITFVAGVEKSMQVNLGQ